MNALHDTPLTDVITVALAGMACVLLFGPPLQKALGIEVMKSVPCQTQLTDKYGTTVIVMTTCEITEN